MDSKTSINELIVYLISLFGTHASSNYSYLTNLPRKKTSNSNCFFKIKHKLNINMASTTP